MTSGNKRKIPAHHCGAQGRFSITQPFMTNTVHFFIMLSATEVSILPWVKEQDHNQLSDRQNNIKKKNRTCNLKWWMYMKQTSYSLPLPCMPKISLVKIYIMMELVYGTSKQKKDIWLTGQHHNLLCWNWPPQNCMVLASPSLCSQNTTPSHSPSSYLGKLQSHWSGQREKRKKHVLFLHKTS